MPGQRAVPFDQVRLMAVTEQQFGRLGLTDEQLDSLLNELDRACQDAVVNEHRRSVRKPFRSVNVRVSILDKALAEIIAFKVPTRNISLHGLAFLHHHMLQIGQALRIQIPFSKGYTVELLARVARCRHISGMIHEIGVEFQGRVSRQGVADKDNPARADRPETAEPPPGEVGRFSPQGNVSAVCAGPGPSAGSDEQRPRTPGRCALHTGRSSIASGATWDPSDRS